MTMARRTDRSIGVIVINFGEPDEPTLEKVEPFLERIFLQNAGLEPDESARARARALASARAPGLVEEYQAIGGSPLNRQADRQTAALEAELRSRGHTVRCYSAFQFTEPGIDECVRQAREDGADLLIGLPVYPKCGQSTNVEALAAVRRAIEALDWYPEYRGVSGWHYDAGYTGLRTDHIASFVHERGLDLGDDDTLLYFSVHGTPLKYLEAGNRYDRYVEEHCRAIAEGLGVDRHAVGFQNHTNRRIAWTQPDNEDRILEASERRLVVVPISFMHEQSETLSELDGELRAFAEEHGKEFHRVPVPHDDHRFIDVLSGLVERLADEASTALSPCRCAPFPGVFCTNGARELPPSPYATEAPAVT